MDTTTTTGAETSFKLGIWSLPSTSTASVRPGYEADDEEDDDNLTLSGLSSLPSSIAVPT